MAGMGLTYISCALLMAACAHAAEVEGYFGTIRPSSGGVTYIRWGRTTCPTLKGTRLVYAGRAAGTYYTYSGGTSDYLCLPDQPQYLNSQAGIQNFSPLYGAEYETRGQPLHSLQDYNVPCAVCHSLARGSLITVPARLSCPRTWTLEYSGYLMSAYRSHSRTSTECVDKDAVGVPGSAKNTGGALLYHMEATCNGIQCPPYESQKELTCAVCTK